MSIIRQRCHCAIVLLLLCASCGLGECPCDKNRDGRVLSDDLLVFLDEWFQGEGRADFDRDGEVVVNDLLEFLRCYFDAGGRIDDCFEVTPFPPARVPSQVELTRPCTCARCAGITAGPPESYTDPVYLFSGEFFLNEEDLRIRGRGFDFVLARKYGSKNGPNTMQGNGWDCSYNIFVEADGQDLLLHNGWTRADRYLFVPADGVWRAASGFFREISPTPSGGYVLEFEDSGSWEFMPIDPSARSGRISVSTDRNGNAMRFSYDGAGRIETVTDTLGREIDFGYHPSGHLATVTDFTDRVVRYDYYDGIEPGGSAGDLKSVTRPAVTGTPNGNDFPSGKKTTYTYTTGFSDDRLNHNLLTITDPRGNTYLKNEYAGTVDPNALGFDRVIRQAWGGPGDLIDIAYQSVTPGASNNQAIVRVILNDRRGHVKELFYDQRNRGVMLREYTGLADPDMPTTATANRPVGPLRPSDPPFFETRWVYNNDSLATRVIHPNGNEERMVYDSSNPNIRARSNKLEHRWLSGPLGGDQPEIVHLFEYGDNIGGCCGTNFVTKYTDGRGNDTVHEYDAAGNRIKTTDRLPSVVTEYGYNQFGQITKRILPDNGSGCRRMDLFNYYNSGPQAGYLKEEIIDATDAEACPGAHADLVTGYEYDDVGNVVRRTDPGGDDQILVVNQLDQVVREISPAVAPGGVRYETDIYYDANDNVVRRDVQNIDDAGVLQANTHFTRIFEYEILNFVTRECAEVGGANLGPDQLDCSGLPVDQFIVTEFGYDANRNKTMTRYGEATNGNQPENIETTEYDERDLIFRWTRAPGHADQSTRQHDYDGNRNPVRVVVGLEDTPREYLYRYDGYNRLWGPGDSGPDGAASIDPMGNTEYLHYDANHNTVRSRIEGELVDIPGSAQNVRLREIMYSHDELDRVFQSEAVFFDVETQAPIGDGVATTQYFWSDNSQEVLRLDDNLNERVTEYDSANRIVRMIDARGNSTTYAYNADSLLASATEVEVSDLGNADQAFVSTRAYDGLDRITALTDAVGNTKTMAYDSRGNRILVTDATQTSTRYLFDGISRATGMIVDLDGDGADGDGPDITTLQAWDDSSRSISRTDDRGNTTVRSYDPLNRVIAESYADCTQTSIVYDVHGNERRRTDGNGTVCVGVYDLRNRLIRKDVSPGLGVSSDTTLEVFSYDGLSRLVGATDDDSVVTRAYDSRSEVIRETLNGSMTACRTDGVGNRLQAVYPGGRRVSVEYDELDRKRTIRDGAGLVAAYDYIGPSRVERREYGNGTRTDLTYNGSGPVAPGDFGVRKIVRSRHSVIGTGALIDDRTYAWDRNYNKTERADVRAGGPRLRHVYTYDRAYRLADTRVTSPVQGLVRETKYDLDGAGNRLEVVGAPDPGVYTLSAARCDPADSQLNQYTTTPFDQRWYDENGSLTTVGNRDDALATMVYDYANRMVLRTDGETGQVSAYRYDVFGRRIERTPDVDVGSAIRYFYSGWQVIEERVGDADTPARTYVYGGSIDEVLRMDAGGRPYYYHTDDLLSVMALTDGAGAVVERYEYDDFGRPVEPGTLSAVRGAASEVGNPYLFNGRRYDAESGWFYYRHRYLDPVAGRFTTRDPIGLWGDAENLGNGASYVGNRPGVLSDPFGLDAPGCDNVPAAVESACVLECCAIHDECYFRNNCTAGSWFSIGTCQGCNIDAVACILACVGTLAGDDPARPNYYCGCHNVWFDDPNSPHMGHSTDDPDCVRRGPPQTGRPNGGCLGGPEGGTLSGPEGGGLSGPSTGGGLSGPSGGGLSGPSGGTLR